MRNGDLYKMQAMKEKIGMSNEDICRQFKGMYSIEEINEFLPDKPKRGRPKKEPETVKVDAE